MTSSLHRIGSSGCTSREFISNFKEDESRLVAAATDDLRDIGLMKLFHEARGRKTPIASSKGQGELFSDYGGLRVFSVPDGKTSRKINVKLPDLKCAQLKQWCDLHEREKVRADQNLRHAKKILEKIDGHWTEETTVREALLAARKTSRLKHA